MIEAQPDRSVTQTESTDGGGGSSRSSIALKLPSFEGPLDLLLHLIRSNEVDIGDIPIALVCEQYLEFLEMMRMLDIDIAADYLAMAATLAYIKSRMLLPSDDGSGDDEGLDPRAELARRLAEYATFKEVAEDFDARSLLGRDVFTTQADRSDVPAADEVLTVSLFSLLDAMKRVLADLPMEEQHHEVTLDRLTLQDRMIYLMDRLRAASGSVVMFEDLLRDGEPSRHRIVMTFLAMLELAKIQALRFFQNVTERGEPYGPVRVMMAVEADDEVTMPEGDPYGS